ncbi:MAG TPA: hypothetical protein P5032_14260, partial [Candidatus Competibacter sp.]|nr:hypothetical protein [Candidatus Competibacter sp.]
PLLPKSLSVMEIIRNDYRKRHGVNRGGKPLEDDPMPPPWPENRPVSRILSIDPLAALAGVWA